MSDPKFYGASVSREDLAEILRGKRTDKAAPLQPRLLPRLSSKEAMVIWADESIRPCIIGISDNDRQELFSWTTVFHRDLSPLSSWCHVLSSQEIGRLELRKWQPQLNGLEAAWAGAAVAEAMILSRRNFDSISLPTCLATDNFAIARTAALYGARAALGETLELLDGVRDRLRRSTNRWRPTTTLGPGVLIRLLPDAPPSSSRTTELLTRACQSLYLQAGKQKESFLADEILRDIISQVPQLSSIEKLDKISAEERVRFLREMRPLVLAATNQEDKHILFFTAGYLISTVGGAELDLRLAEMFDAGYPNVLTWAAILGGLGARTYWADAFGGIGRLVARELSRSVDISDPPTADISADEFLVLSTDERGSAKFRSAQRNVATISLRTGVVVQLALSDEDRARVRPDEIARPPVSRPTGGLDRDHDQRGLQTLAEQLFPHLRTLFVRAGFAPSSQKRSDRKGKNPQLPLK